MLLGLWQLGYASAPKLEKHLRTVLGCVELQSNKPVFFKWHSKAQINREGWIRKGIQHKVFAKSRIQITKISQGFNFIYVGQNHNNIPQGAFKRCQRPYNDTEKNPNSKRPPLWARTCRQWQGKTSCLKTQEGVRVCSKAMREDMQRVSLRIFSIWLKHHQSLGLTLKE